VVFKGLDSMGIDTEKGPGVAFVGEKGLRTIKAEAVLGCGLRWDRGQRWSGYCATDSRPVHVEDDDRLARMTARYLEESPRVPA
jgi:hypothetical protein